MTERERGFQSEHGYTLHYREWLPPGDAKGTVFIAHGLGEHSGRYRHVAAALTEAGFACCGIDQRGHGKSGGLRAYVPDLRHTADDLGQLIDIATERRPGLPAFCFGHSMGSLTGLEYTLCQPDTLRGIALSGCAIDVDQNRPAWLIALCLRAAPYLSKLRLSPPVSPTALTHDADLLQEWWDDPLVDKGMWRVGTSAAIVQSGRRIRESAHQLRLPILALHGEDDHLTPASGSRFLGDQAAGGDVTVQVYPELRHELVNETGGDAIIDTLVSWFSARV